MHSCARERRKKDNDGERGGGVNRGSSKNTNISGGFYMMTVYFPAVIICVSTTAQQHFKNRGPLSSLSLRPVHTDQLLLDNDLMNLLFYQTNLHVLKILTAKCT